MRIKPQRRYDAIHGLRVLDLKTTTFITYEQLARLNYQVMMELKFN